MSLNTTTDLFLKTEWDLLWKQELIRAIKYV